MIPTPTPWYLEQDAETDVYKGNSLPLLFCKLMLEMKLESGTAAACCLSVCESYS